MSKTLTFIQPNGLDEVNPKPEFIKKLIFDRGDEYWQPSAGDAAFWYDENGDRKADLIVVGKEPYGFRLEYVSYLNDDDSVLLSEEVGEETVVAQIGGNKTSFPKNHFVPKELAWNAIEYFLKTGKKLESLYLS